MFHGFHSLEDYLKACESLGFTVRKVHFRSNAQDYSLLYCHYPKTRLFSWHLFMSDGTKEVMDGAIFSDSVEELFADVAKALKKGEHK